MKIAYLTNQYPHVRHTFIRREIVALEALGVEVVRFSIRDSGRDAVDPADIEEKKKTESLLAAGKVRLLFAWIATFIAHPIRWLKALALATKFGRRAPRSVLKHWAYFAEACLLRKRLRQCGAEHLHVHFATNPAVVKYPPAIKRPWNSARPKTLRARSITRASTSGPETCCCPKAPS